MEVKGKTGSHVKQVRPGQTFNWICVERVYLVDFLHKSETGFKNFPFWLMGEESILCVFVAGLRNW